METQLKFVVRIATHQDYKYAAEIANAMNLSAKQRGIGIKVRTPEYIEQKIKNGLAIIAIHAETFDWAGFCSIEVWEHEKLLANTGLIVSPKYRGLGLSKEIKIKMFELSKIKYPSSRIFSLTTNSGVIESNLALGYQFISFAEITNDPYFLSGRNSWVDYPSIMQKENSKYVAMIYDPELAIDESVASKKIFLSFSKEGFEKR